MKMSVGISIFHVILLILVTFGSVHASDYSDGVAAYEGGKHGEAFQIWQPLAEQGDADAQLALGMYYRLIERNEEKFWEWITKAVEQGHADAQYVFGTISMGQGDASKAESWYQQACAQGQADAQKALLELYAGGYHSGDLDYIEAYIWSNYLASTGDPYGSEINTILEKKMTPEEISLALKMFRDEQVAADAVVLSELNKTGATLELKLDTSAFDLVNDLSSELDTVIYEPLRAGESTYDITIKSVGFFEGDVSRISPRPLVKKDKVKDELESGLRQPVLITFGAVFREEYLNSVKQLMTSSSESESNYEYFPRPPGAFHIVEIDSIKDALDTILYNDKVAGLEYTFSKLNQQHIENIHDDFVRNYLPVLEISFLDSKTNALGSISIFGNHEVIREASVENQANQSTIADAPVSIILEERSADGWVAGGGTRMHVIDRMSVLAGIYPSSSSSANFNVNMFIVDRSKFGVIVFLTKEEASQIGEVIINLHWQEKSSLH